MAGVIDMRTMRYINLFSKISHISTTNCFMYNGQIVFAVPEEKVSLAIGRGAENVRRLSSLIGKRVKIVSNPKNDGREGITKFIGEVVSPVDFSKVEIHDGVVVISASRQSKAALIGRDRIREKELFDALRNFFQITKLRVA
jgi:NusA-like KH domain protein